MPFDQDLDFYLTYDGFAPGDDPDNPLQVPTWRVESIRINHRHASRAARIYFWKPEDPNTPPFEYGYPL
jgi:hypothetical protein